MLSPFAPKFAVDYLCKCDSFIPLPKLFFCRHCLELRCGSCCMIEVDSYFCGNCLENIPSTEAKHKKYKCSNCFDCPSCQHTLSARATTVNRREDEPSTPDGEAPATPAEKPAPPKKMYYLACLACRWTSRDPGIPDQTVATGAWPELEIPHDIRFQKVLEYSQSIVLQRKQEKQDGWKRGRGAGKSSKFPSLTDRSGLTVSSIRRQINWHEKAPAKVKVEEIPKSQATDEIPALPEDFFTKEVHFKHLSTIEQRLNQIAIQPENVGQLYPQHKSLSIKKSLRCRQCQHNVMKPELNPNSIKYRIQLFAVFHVPEIRLMDVGGDFKECRIKLINPTMYDMTPNFVPLEETENFPGTNAKILYTKEPFELMRRDDAVDLEDVKVATPQMEAPDFVVNKKGNTVVCLFPVTVGKDVQPGEEIKAAVKLQYTYTNTTNVAEKKESQKQDLIVTAILSLGIKKN